MVWHIYKLIRMRERKCRDPNHFKCIKSKDQRVLVMDKGIREVEELF